MISTSIFYYSICVCVDAFELVSE